MKFGHQLHRLFALAFLVATLATLALHASAQSIYTATEQYSLSAWGGASGTYVNLPLRGRNFGITAGADLRVWQYHGFLPSVEIRGTYPVSSGSVASEENVLGGIKIEHPLGRRYHPYGEFLFGRGEVKYQGSGYIYGLFVYQQTFSNVLAPGAGVDIDVTHHFAVKLDAQLWHMSVPVTTSGTLNSLTGTVAVIYRFDFNHAPKVPRDTRPR